MSAKPGDGGALDHEPEADLKMTIWEHLQELRSRLVKASIGVFIGTIVCWYYRVQILAWLVHPYEKVWFEQKLPGTPELQTLSPADAFVGYLQIALVGGIILGVPVIFWQLWSFVSPGLYQREKRYIVPFVTFSTGLFLSGVAFAYYAMFPAMFRFFFSQLGTVGAQGMALTQKPTLEYYLDFTTRALLVFGAVFELPLLIFFLSLAGIVSPMQLLRFGRWAVLLAFVVGAIATPGPEIMSQLLLSGALIALYFVSVGVAFLVGNRKKEKAAGQAAQDKAEEEKAAATKAEKKTAKGKKGKKG
jgi:sec-independent protein translocase protein TatC